jgi:hypothetical protein
VDCGARDRQSGRIGELRLLAGLFSYFNDDPKNIRNIIDWGGGGTWTSAATSSTLRG